MAPNTTGGTAEHNKSRPKLRNPGLLEESSVEKNAETNNVVEYYEELFKDLMLSTDGADSSSRKTCFCESHWFYNNDDNSNSNDEGSKPDLDKQRLSSSSLSSSFVINLQSDSSSSDSDSEEDEPEDKDTRFS